MNEIYHPAFELHDKRFALKQNKLEQALSERFKREEFNELENVAFGTVHFINEVINKKPGRIFFLDKSARPASYLFRETWRKISSEKMPEISFINIGREGNPIDDEVVAFLKKTYNRNSKKEESPEKERILIADDFVGTRNSLNRSLLLLREVFPRSEVDTTRLFSVEPFWHRESGKGVMDRVNIFDARKYVTVPDKSGRKEALLLREKLSLLAEAIASAVEDKRG